VLLLLRVGAPKQVVFLLQRVELGFELELVSLSPFAIGALGTAVLFATSLWEKVLELDGDRGPCG
jgi:hypothetical protein